MLKIFYCIIIGIIHSAISIDIHAKEKSTLNTADSSLNQLKPSLNIGAQVFTQRCALCHGSQGSGDGIIPQKLKFYPSTNLLKARFSIDKKSVHEITVFGGSRGDMSPFMPPMGNDLTWTQLESVVDFIVLLRANKTKAIAHLNAIKHEPLVSRRLGQQVYKSRCVLCHGEYGEGDGRMARVIKTPPPFDLTSSRQSDEYLKAIIVNGGEYMQRSYQMPPWKNELSNSEIESVVAYLKSIRD